MSDCFHCDIHDLLKDHLEGEQADLTEISAKVTEVLADLILLADPGDQAMLMAEILGNLGTMLIEKSQQEADPSTPRLSRH
jgi:hypothetical protein